MPHICTPLTFTNTHPEMAEGIKTYLRPWKQHKRNVSTSVKLKDLNILWFRNPSSSSKSLSISMNIAILQRIFPNSKLHLHGCSYFNKDPVRLLKASKKGIHTTTIRLAFIPWKPQGGLRSSNGSNGKRQKSALNARSDRRHQETKAVSQAGILNLLEIGWKSWKKWNICGTIWRIRIPRSFTSSSFLQVLEQPTQQGFMSGLISRRSQDEELNIPKHDARCLEDYWYEAGEESVGEIYDRINAIKKLMEKNREWHSRRVSYQPRRWKFTSW